MKLDAYKVQHIVPDMVPGTVKREWMDEVRHRHAYRCLPLNMANVSGWDLKLTHGFDATWTGGNAAEDITIVPHDPAAPIAHIAASHFSYGILTFHTGYLFRTPPGWAMWAMAAPNSVKDGIDPLAGLIETDWLPYPFTMNWKFTRPGTVRFERGETFCFLTLVQPEKLEDVEPVIRDIDDNAPLKAEYEEWRSARAAFNARIAAEEPDALREAWQKHYMKGRKPSGAQADTSHTNRRRLAMPRKD
ncbi:MAG: DUF6065 family protein [Pseudomonadota bacterium]